MGSVVKTNHTNLDRIIIMSQDQENLDLMMEGINEAEGTTVDLETALAADKEAAKAEKLAEKEAAKAMKTAEKEAAKALKEAEKQAKLDAKAAEKQAKLDAKAEKQAKKAEPKVLQEKQNDVTKPKPESDCGKIWDLCTALSNEKGELVLKKEVSASPLASEFHPTTVGVQYYKWKKFYGIV